MIRPRTLSGKTMAMLLIAVALLVRAAIPQGWMVDATAASGPAIAMCNSDMTVTIPFKPGQAPKQDDDRGQPCAFAGHQGDGTPADGVAPLPLPLLAPAAYDATRARAVSPESAPNLPPATGPPAVA